MADDSKQPDDEGKPETDRFGYGQQPLYRVDETTGDEGIEPPMGDGHDEATIGRTAEIPDSKDDRNADDPKTPQAP